MASMPAVLGLARGLVLASHPIPTLAVTAISAGLAALAGTGFGSGVLVTLAVLAGQLSIGWSNDRIDAARDAAVERSDKPLASGTLAPAAVSAAATAAVAAAVVFSLLLGWRAAIAAMLIVVCGWLYNLGLKATPWSWLPYAIAFGTLPAVATLALPSHRLPAGWAIAAGALLGVAAHFANVLPDLIADAATGVSGLPHRLGARASVVLGPVLLLGASASIIFGAAGRVEAIRWAALAAAAALTGVAMAAGWRRPASRVFFLATLLVAVADIVLFGLSGGRLT